MECPYCEKELTHHDTFGRLFPHQDGQILGYIYKCENEDCEKFESYFYSYINNIDNLHEGYPC